MVYHLVMSSVTLSEAKAQLAKLLRQVEDLGERVVITRSGHPAGVLLSVEEYEGLIESLEILADPELSAAVRQGLADLERGDVLSDEEVWRDLEAPVRR
jgi:prevent-host-death family protein